MEAKMKTTVCAAIACFAVFLVTAGTVFGSSLASPKADEGLPCGGVARIGINGLDAAYKYEGEDFPTYYASFDSASFIDVPSTTTSGGESLGHVTGGYFEISVRTYLDVPYLNFEARMSAGSSSWALSDYMGMTWDGTAMPLSGVTLTGGSETNAFNWETLSLGRLTDVATGWHRLRFTYNAGFPNLDYITLIADRTALAQKAPLTIAENGEHIYEAESVDYSNAVFLNENSDKVAVDAKASGGAYLAPVKATVSDYNWGYLSFEIQTAGSCSLNFAAYVNMPGLVAVGSMYKRFTVTCDGTSFGNLSAIAAQTNADDWVSSACPNALAVAAGYHIIKLAYEAGTGSGAPKLDYFKLVASGYAA